MIDIKKPDDCVIRALCEAYDLTWLEAFMKLKALRRTEQRKKEWAFYLDADTFESLDAEAREIQLHD